MKIKLEMTKNEVFDVLRQHIIEKVNGARGTEIKVSWTNDLHFTFTIDEDPEDKPTQGAFDD